jgi:hypothetical protein
VRRSSDTGAQAATLATRQDTEAAAPVGDFSASYIEALNVGLLGERESKGLVRDRALLEEAERLNRSAGSESAAPSTIPPPSGRVTIPPPSWKQSRS